MAENAIAPRPNRHPAAGVEKAAILLLTLPTEAAAGIFRHLSEPEIRQVTAALSRLRSIPREHAAAVHEEAWRWLTNREGYLVDGEQFARKILSSSTRDPQMEALREIEPSCDALATSLEPVPPQVLAQILVDEHPQVIAFTLANLRPRQAADVLRHLPEDVAPDIVQRIAELQAMPPGDLLAEVAGVLQGQAAGLAGTSQIGEEGFTKRAAEIMNLLDKSVETQIFGNLEQTAPEVAERIRDQMLTFADLAALENRDMQVLLKEVTREDLILGLRTAPPAMRERVFKNISARAAEILEEEMSTMGPVRLADVERAQANVVTVARRLAEEGKIAIAGSGGDVLV